MFIVFRAIQQTYHVLFLATFNKTQYSPQKEKDELELMYMQKPLLLAAHTPF